MRTFWKAVFVLPVLCLAACGQKEADNDDGQTVALAQPIAYSEAEKAAIQATFPAPYDSADLSAGEKQFNKCRACHTITPDGMNLTGPHLFGMFGRKAAAVDNYTYSEAMQKHAVVWDFETLDAFLKSPQQTVKGTKMGYQGIKDDTDRRNLIAYLKLMTAPKTASTHSQPQN